jgi:nucleoid-associated protein YgaU
MIRTAAEAASRRGFRRRRVLGVLLPAALHAGATALLAWASASPLQAVRSPGAATLEDLLAVAAAAAAWCVLTWLTAGLLVTVLALVRGGGALQRVAPAVAPRAVRRAAALLLGVSLVSTPLGGLPALADNGTAGTAGVAAATATTSPRTPGGASPAELAGWTPDRPAPPPKPQVGAGSVGLVTTTPRPERAVREALVVRRGDTLWDIAASHLGPDASPAEVAVEWPRWYAANRATIGPDPGLIRPGQRLRAPVT